jgi:hypothetical protein
MNRQCSASPMNVEAEDEGSYETLGQGREIVAMVDEKKIRDVIGLVLLSVFYFSITFLGSTLVIGLVMGNSIPEIFYLWIDTWFSIVDSLRSMLNEFAYDILGT